MQYKNEPGDAAAARVEFVNAWKAVLANLAAYVKDNHRTGVSWNARGVPVAQHSAKKSTSAPPPPPPPPPAAAPTTTGTGGGMASVFSQLNSGTGVTSGLRHVKKGDLAAPPAGVAVAKAPAAPARSSASAPAASKPPRTVLEGKKWAVEYHVNEPAIVLEQVRLQETVYVYKCEGTAVEVSAKVNQITLDSCKKTSLVFVSAMSGIELVNCQGCKVHVKGSVATITVDKCDGTQLILSREAMGANIISAKSSELNIIVSGATDEDEYKEHAIAEQFVSKYVNGKFVTTVVEHTA